MWGIDTLLLLPKLALAFTKSRLHIRECALTEHVLSLGVSARRQAVKQRHPQRLGMRASVSNGAPHHL